MREIIVPNSTACSCLQGQGRTLLRDDDRFLKYFILIQVKTKRILHFYKYVRKHLTKTANNAALYLFEEYSKTLSFFSQSNGCSTASTVHMLIVQVATYLAVQRLCLLLRFVVLFIVYW